MNTKSIKFIREGARVLASGGVFVHADYTSFTKEPNNSHVFFTDQLRFQHGGNWHNYVLKQIQHYRKPYKDVTAEMEPPFVSWISEAYGLGTIFAGSQKEVAQLCADQPDIAEYLQGYSWNDIFQVVMSRKISS